ncbi:MAG: hypothetical protein KKB50_03625 [Planctomycetes bacterium]|nr:hypothetical protein [Planctomycetota bacterium]
MWLGERSFALWEPINLGRLSLLTVNLFALYLAIAGTTMFVSSLFSRRGTAIAVVMSGLLVSVLVNFLAQFWSAIEWVSFLGVLNYYRPLPVVRSGEWPVRDLIVLVLVGGAFWSAGLWRFSRRDIPAV